MNEKKELEWVSLLDENFAYSIHNELEGMKEDYNKKINDFVIHLIDLEKRIKSSLDAFGIKLINKNT